MKKQIKLLVVDDHTSYGELIARSADLWNEHYEFECEFVDSATAALEKIATSAPTIVLADAHIPDMNSMHFIDECSALAVPLVVTSDHLLASLEESVLSRGAKAYLPKTDDPDELEHIFEQIALIAEDIELEH